MRGIARGLWLTAAVGCGPVSEVNGEGPTTEVGTITLVANDQESLSGTFHSVGADVQFEVVRGDPIPEDVTAADVTAPSFEIDARVMTLNGEPFAERLGGHGYILPTWMIESAQEWPVPDDNKRRIEWDVAVDLGLRIADGRLEAVAPDLALALEELIEGSMVDVESEGDVGVLRSAQNTYHHHFEIWYKPVVYDRLAQHSSTRALYHSPTGTLLQTIFTCNHGTCGAVAPNTLKCSTLYQGRNNRLPPTADCTRSILTSENYGSLSCCNTLYGPTNGRHVCNDDTITQRQMMAYNGNPPAVPSQCSDNTLERYAPSCY
jgi:hypothetical protein